MLIFCIGTKISPNLISPTARVAHQEEGERERVEYVSLLIGTHTYNAIYMHFILLFLLLLLQCMLLESTHCFVALNMHENQQHPPHLNKPYNYASMQSGPSIAFSIRCLLTQQLYLSCTIAVYVVTVQHHKTSELPNMELHSIQYSSVLVWCAYLHIFTHISH